MERACSLLCYHVFCVWLCHTLLHYLMSDKIFRKEIFKHKYLSCFRLQSRSEKFIFLRKIRRKVALYILYIYVRLYVKYPLSLSEFI